MFLFSSEILLCIYFLLDIIYLLYFIYLSFNYWKLYKLFFFLANIKIKTWKKYVMIL